MKKGISVTMVGYITTNESVYVCACVNICLSSPNEQKTENRKKAKIVTVTQKFTITYEIGKKKEAKTLRNNQLGSVRDVHKKMERKRTKCVEAN